MDMKIFSELYQKLKNKFKNCSSGCNLTESDYYNGSSNDIENIFLELKKLVNPRFCPCKVGSVRDRINFLVSEGLQIVNFYDNAPISTKIDEEELEEFFNKKIKTKKKTTKKSNGRKRG
jgi:hypothetical protein